ncbi:MAG: helix-turn-helix domain-containing protein [Acidobacteria bacterium]|nr:helix-turn-helix domain-containing protein [Acidobacteriota bacterium]
MPDPDRPQDPALLSSWKEIAAYLGVNVRTAQNWEVERGLPIRRLPGGRGRVFISISELDEWLEKRPEVAGAPEELPPHRLQPRRWMLALAALALVCGTALAWYLWRRTLMPSEWSVANNSLIVLDDHGRELWRKRFDFALTDYAIAQRRLHDLGAIGDINSDGQPEVVFLVFPFSPSSPAMVLCFDASGNELWRFVPGKRMATPKDVMEPPYTPLGVCLLRTRAGVRIAVSSSHTSEYATQVALLSPQGKLLREYWHSGHLQFLRPLQRDGHQLLLAGGIANGYKQAVLVTLDPETMAGVSLESNKDYQLAGPPAVEVSRVLFPRSCMNLARKPFNGVSVINLLPDRFSVNVREELEESTASVQHLFDSAGHYLGADMASDFVGRHRELETAGILKHALNEKAETEALNKIVWVAGGPPAR